VRVLVPVWMLEFKNCTCIRIAYRIYNQVNHRQLWFQIKCGEVSRIECSDSFVFLSPLMAIM